MDPTQDLIVISEHRSVSSLPLACAVYRTDPGRPASVNPERNPPTHRYHLLTLSTLQPHPLAQMPTLDFPPLSQVIEQTRQLLQVMGDSLVVLVSRFAPAWFLAGMGLGPLPNLLGLGHEEELVAWNWKEGRVLAVSPVASE